MAKKERAFEENLKEVAALIDRRWAKQHPLSEDERELFRHVAGKSWDVQEKARKMAGTLNLKVSKRALRKMMEAAKPPAQGVGRRGAVQPLASTQPAHAPASNVTAKRATKRPASSGSARRPARKVTKPVKGHKQ
jgi:hypothetical protein